EIGLASVSYPDLLTAKDVVIALQFGTRIYVCGIRARVRLGEGKGPEDLGARQPRQILLLLGFGAELIYDELRQAVHGEHASKVTAQPGQFFEDDGITRIIQPATAVLGGKRDCGESEFTQFPKQRPRKLFVAVLVPKRFDVSRDKLLNKLLELFLFFGQ